MWDPGQSTPLKQMKSFFGSFFGTLFAVFLLIVVGLLGCVAVIALIGTSAKGPTVADNTLLVLDLAVPITDAPREFDTALLVAGLTEEQQEQAPVSLRDVLRAIIRAATDPKIKGIFITGNLLPVGGYASSYPAMKEIREALKRFKESHKTVYAYLQFPFTQAYYLESVADQLFVDPQAEFILRGPSSSPLYYAGALKKFGVGVQVFRVGKYKSFVEPYIRDNMSPENREQLEKLFGDMWSEVTTSIEQARGLPHGSFEQLINENGLIDGELAVKSKLGTELATLAEVMDRLRKLYGSDEQHRTFRQVTVSTYLNARDGKPNTQSDAGSKIAIVYAEGEIVDGEGSGGNVGGERYAREIRKFHLDPSVKAIILRVNSPGGSGFASEEIYRELQAADQTKPVVVSMGGYAASGGYYISTASKHIFAEPTTITGSIGVFGLEINFEKLANDNGITTDSVTTTSPLATLFNPIKQKSDADLAILQKAVDRFYSQFLDRVSQGRHLAVEQVNEIAQGRVWSGSEALRVKLVDEIGGLSSAIGYAANLARLGEHPRIVEYPARKDLSERLKELLKSTPRPPVARFDPVGLGVQELENELKDLRALNDPEGIYARFPTDILWN
jgi:protease IV